MYNNNSNNNKDNGSLKEITRRRLDLKNDGVRRGVRIKSPTTMTP